MTINNTLRDAGGVPVSSAIVPGNATPVPLQGTPGAFSDAQGNPSTGIVINVSQPRFVQKNSAVTVASAKTLSCAFTSPVTQGNSIVVALGMGEVEGANIVLTLTDTLGNTYTEAISSPQGAALEAAIFSVSPINVSGSDTITATISGISSTNTAISMEIYEVWGLIAFSGAALDKVAVGSNAGSTAISTGALIPVAPNEIAFVAMAAAGGVLTAGTGWTLDSGTLSPLGGGLVSFGAETTLFSTTTTQSPAATLSVSNAWAAAAATFKPVIIPVGGTVNATLTGNIAQESGGNLAATAASSATVATNTGTTATNTGTTVTNTAATNTVLGATADAAVVGDTAGTASAKLRGLSKILNAVWDSVNNLLHANIKQVGGTAVSTGTGAGGAGIPRVTVSNDSTMGANSATGSGVPVNAFYGGGLTKTALPTAATDGNLTGHLLDVFGRQVVVLDTVRNLKGNIPGLTLTTTTETALIAAVASTFNDITGIVCVNTSATLVRVDFRDALAGTIQFSLEIPATETRGFSNMFFKQGTVNTAWTAQLSAAVTDVRIYGTYVANK